MCFLLHFVVVIEVRPLLFITSTKEKMFYVIYIFYSYICKTKFKDSKYVISQWYTGKNIFS